MQVKLIEFTPNPERVIADAARTCYSPKTTSDLTDRPYDAGSDAEYLRKVLASGHLSVVEHASFTFGVDGISRACSHQLVRHRIASYSQQSQRYVELKEGQKVDYVMPPSIDGNHGREVIFNLNMNNAVADYLALVADGVPAEDARYLLPNAMATNITVTMNARSLLNFFSLRCCNRAQWEIRELADKMLDLVRPLAPTVFEHAGPSCRRGNCPEGKMSCGKPRT